ncbi:MAG: tetratricopeptide repeat protein [Treponema sp.]|jgi:tetratricopeptide (TPR) repeat protein|nr:tetratricopeptide repeat protein [Treponema sp.]
MNFLPILLALVAVLVVGLAMAVIMGRSRGGGLSGKRSKGDGALLKNAQKRLMQNPRDPEALFIMADNYYREESWDKAYKAYETLLELVGSHPNIDEFEVNLRSGVTALKLGLTDAAYKNLAVARSLKQNNFEVNFNLGTLEFQKKNYEKAIQLLQQARSQDPEHAPALRYLGHSFFKIKKYKEAMAFIRKAMDIAPDDKESLYTLGECYYEANQTDQALRIFAHLRADPVMGPSACLFSGTINISQHQPEKAIEDFEIGLKHVNIKPDVAIELKYRLATAYLKQNEMSKALALLREVQGENGSYKDVSQLIARYQELNANKNLQIFLMAPSADFIALCRRLVMNYYPRAKTKITNIAVSKNEWADLLAEVDTPKWSDVVMFRFIRSQGSTGELIVRDFHSHLKEVKAGKGICISPGVFTVEAKRYTEARLIDLIDKERLNALLNSLDAKTKLAPAKK